MAGDELVAVPNNDTFVASAVTNGGTPLAVVAAPNPTGMTKSGAAGNPWAKDADALEANDAIVRTSMYDPNKLMILSPSSAR